LGKNYGGSKVWPAPQGWTSEQEWPGPPDAVLDCGPYDWHAALDSDSATIQLQSQHDDYTGITMRREIKVRAGSSSVEVLHTMLNTSRRPVRWSIWQVTQVNAPQGLEIFIPAAGFHQTFGDKPYNSVSFSPADKRVHVKYDDQVAKVAVEANQGWFASLDKARGVVLAETFPVTPGASYPDEAPVAFWISGRGTFTIHGDRIDMSAGTGYDPHVETEIMSPLTNLEPGDSFQLRTAWHVAAMDAQEIVAVNRCAAIGAPLAFQSGSPARFTGAFGSFWEANIELIAYDRASQIVGTFDLGGVNPRTPVRIDQEIPVPAGTVRCSLVMFDRERNQLGVLDRVNIR
ncbi:MAG TPA: DUF4380 domain-containing protein, partial [Candidatus Binatia bacterium]|nr:DUF4380 domain-containing protein [Candidatus Binatia bacterium]